MFDMRKPYTHHGRFEDIINIKFSFQGNKRMRYQVMKPEVCGIITWKEKPLDLNIGNIIIGDLRYITTTQEGGNLSQIPNPGSTIAPPC